MHRIVLWDDGTLDTVIRCADCGECIRFNYDSENATQCYQDFVKDCIAEVERDHECGDDS